MNPIRICALTVASFVNAWLAFTLAAFRIFTFRSARGAVRVSPRGCYGAVFAWVAAFALTGPAAPTAAAQGATVTESVLYSFCAGGSQCPDNAVADGLIQASDGNFYGITATGGANTDGSFFMMTPAGAETTLYSFCSQGGSSCSDGEYPADMVLGGDGNFYGTTAGGGANGQGTVFKVTSSGSLDTLYSFCSQGGSSCTDGSVPEALIQGSDGNFYGTTAGSTAGGTGNGTVFEITPSGTLTTLYTFCSQGGSSCTDGLSPLDLVQGSDGNFYGTTTLGGSGSSVSFYNAGASSNQQVNGAGTVFKLTSSGTLTTLYAFCKNAQSAEQCSDGFGPNDLVEGSDGNFYGTTQYGGTGDANVAYDGPSNGGGTAFKITSGGTLSTLYNFCSQGSPTCSDGGGPLALIEGSDGNFYGVNSVGGALFNDLAPFGTAFEITSSGTQTTLYSFCSGAGSSSCSDAMVPDALVQGSDGNFYGASQTGGQYIDGAIFKLALAPALSAPVQLSISSAQIDLGQSATLSWQVLNGASATMQQCYAFVQNGVTGAGTWTGLQSGTAANGVYSGSATLTPTAEGTYTYALTCGGTESGFAALTAGAAQPLAISTTSLPGGTLGVGYAQTLAATGGVPPYAWSVTSGSLPAGLSLAASTGAITGTPAQAGTSSFTVQVKDSASTPNTVTAQLSIAIAAPPMTISTTGLPSATVGTAYAQTLAATGGVPPYTWSVSSGTLPQGLTLSASAGTISGTPTATGTSSFTVEAQDSESTPETATANLSIAVNAALLPGVTLSPTSLTFAAQDTGSTSAAQTVTLTNSGTGALSLTSIAASGDFAETNNCGSSVAASSDCTISVTFTPTAGGALSGTLTINDNASGSPQTVTLTGTGSTVTESATTNSLSISSAGGQTTDTIQLSSAGGFSGTVSFTCAVAYQGTGSATDAPACSLSPTQASVASGSTASTTLTVTTTAATTSRLTNPFLPLGGTAFAALLFFIGAPRRRWRGWSLLAVLFVVIAGTCLGCGGGSSGGTTTNTGTTTGSYNVTVTATSGTVTASVSIPLTVQ